MESCGCVNGGARWEGPSMADHVRVGEALTKERKSSAALRDGFAAMVDVHGSIGVCGVSGSRATRGFAPWIGWTRRRLGGGAAVASSGGGHDWPSHGQIASLYIKTATSQTSHDVTRRQRPFCRRTPRVSLDVRDAVPCSSALSRAAATAAATAAVLPCLRPPLPLLLPLLAVGAPRAPTSQQGTAAHPTASRPRLPLRCAPPAHSVQHTSARHLHRETRGRAARPRLDSPGAFCPPSHHWKSTSLPQSAPSPRRCACARRHLLLVSLRSLHLNTNPSAPSPRPHTPAISSATPAMAPDDAAAALEPRAYIETGVATPTLISPPESKTPPTAAHKRNQTVFASNAHQGTSEPLDVAALSKRLEQFEQAGRVRDRTPTASPSRKRPRIYGDR